MGFDTLHDKVSLLVCGKHRVCIYLLCSLCSLRTCLALYSTTAEWIFGIWDKMHYQIPVNLSSILAKSPGSISVINISMLYVMLNTISLLL